jgi:DNA-binding transcriptional LysR family regulator
VLTEQGRALLADARAVAGNVDLFKARAKTLAGGLEPELSVAVEVMFPLAPLTAAVAAFQEEFPATLLQFDVESGAVVEPVLDGRCAIGVWCGGRGGWALAPPQLTREPLLTVRTFCVVSPQHPLATHPAPIPPTILGEHIQLVHADIADLAQADRPGLLSPKVWRLSHLGAKIAFLRAGLGFGLMPLHMIEVRIVRDEDREADVGQEVDSREKILGVEAPSESRLFIVISISTTTSLPLTSGSCTNCAAAQLIMSTLTWVTGRKLPRSTRIARGAAGGRSPRRWTSGIF